MILPPEHLLTRELVRRGGLHEFVQAFWPVIEPGVQFLDNWHIREVCNALEAVTRGDTGKLIINIPPGHCKSSIVSVMWPAWHWIERPSDRWQNVSWSETLVLRDARKLIEILRSPLYQLAFPDAARLATANPADGNFWTEQKGQRLSTTPRKGATGEHCHVQVWDDPNKADDANKDPKHFESTYEQFTGTFASRAAEPGRFARVVIAQRIGELDLPGRLLAEGGWDHVMFPARYVPDAFWDRGNTLGVTDQRTKPGELLWPTRYDDKSLTQLEKELKNEAEAQIQQNPHPRKGSFFEESWCMFDWIELPEKARFYQSWDLSFGGKTAAHSQCHGALWAVGKASKFRRQTQPLSKVLTGTAPEYEIVELDEPRLVYCLVDEVVGWWNYPTAKAEFLKAQKRPHWKGSKTLIEAKANGIALCDELEAAGHRLTRITPKDSKETRAAVASAEFESESVLFPSADRVRTTWDFRNELVKFPRGANDDRVDTTSQVLIYVTDKMEAYRKAMEAAKPNLRRMRHNR